MTSSVRSSGGLRPLACFILIALPIALEAQSTTSGGSPSLELPVLVVDHEHRPADGFVADQFKIKSGAKDIFSPTAVRKEGDDPISLAILIDASRDSFHDLGGLGDDLAALTGPLLLPSDRISVYALDCAMTRSLNAAAPDPAAMRKAVTDALEYPTLHGGKKSSSCGKTVHLWDSVAAVAASLAHAPGRRVLLLISSGVDGGSKYDWQTVHQYAFDQSVAIFALRDQKQADADTFTRQDLSTEHSYGGSVIATMHPVPKPRNATDIELICANTGGLTLSSTTLFRKDALADLVFLVRNRFILTIPRDAVPQEAQSVKVSLGASPYFVSSTGAGVPLRKP